MRTDDLIRGLASEPSPRPGWSLEVRLALACAIGFAALLSVVLAWLGLRPEPSALMTATGALKIVGTVAIAGAAFRVACRLSRPGTAAICPVSAALILVAIGAAVAAFAESGPTLLFGVFFASVFNCIETIALLAIVPLAASLAVLKAGAPTRPGAAGAAAGLLSGGLAAAAFALYCPVDNPVYVVLGYGTAITLLGALGAAVGSRLLRW